MTQSGTLILLVRGLLGWLIFISLQKHCVTCNRRHGLPSRLLLADEPAPDANATDKGLLSGESGDEANVGANADANGEPFECEVFADYGKNYLTPIDVVVKNSDDNVACIKARFALSIKVEEEFTLAPRFAPSTANATKAPLNDTIRSILGYLPLEHVLSVEDSCPIKKVPPKTQKPANETQTNGRSDEKEPAEPEVDELEMIVTFGCGKLSFTFKRDETRIFVSSIKGLVKLDKNVVREFISLRPTFLTSDLGHHFKYDDLIEVASEAKSKTYILTANFYFTELEAFRKTTSRDFIQPPDESSKPFLSDETNEIDEKGAQKRAPADGHLSAATQQPPPPSKVPPETNKT